MGADPILSQGVGYGVVVGIGFFFAFFMIAITFIQGRYTQYKASNAEEFTSASRSVKPGLIASGIVSAWTWAATLLQSSAVAYNYGISGPWWYAAGATVQILLFAQNAAKLKLNAPGAHTFLEVIYVRWGPVAHCVFMFFALATNIIVSSMLVLGGSATVTALTGMSTLAACFLIPVGVVVYVLVGGMRATLLCDYSHTTILFAIILTFMFTVYATSDKIGSPGEMYNLLTEAAAFAPVKDNAQGSFLTMRSKEGLIFGVINVIGNFATVYNDQAYWQRAIASKPVTAVKGFLLGGLAWFSVPFGFATTMARILGPILLHTSDTSCPSQGLAAVALSHRPDPFFTLTPGEVSAGLPAPAAAAALLGKSGAAAMLVLLFLAVTSAMSAELIAVSSVLTYDVYKTYFNPHADEKRILYVSHAFIAMVGVIMGLLGLIFYYIGISMGWLYVFMGTILGSAVCPIAMAIMSSRANKWGCVSGAVAGFFAGVSAWLITTSCLNDGVIDVATSGGNYEMLAGNLASIGVGTIISVATSYIWPSNYDFEDTRKINIASVSAGADLVRETSDVDSDKEKRLPEDDSAYVQPVLMSETDEAESDPAALQKAFKFALWCSVIITIIFILLIPLPLFFSSHVYGEAGFGAWVGIGFAWTFAGGIIVVIYPMYESRVALTQIGRGMVKDLFSPGSGKYVEPSKSAA